MNLESTIDEYPFTVRPLAAEDGSGFLIEYPDLPGCISDGATAEEAIRNGRDAVLSYLRSCIQHNDPIPRPGSTERVARVPLTISVKRIRTRAKLSQAEFAKRYGFKVRTLQDWELGRAKPDAAVRAYLTVIAKNPNAVEEALVR